VFQAGAERALIKRCLIERGLELDERSAVVPWGANLDEIRQGLRHLLLPGADPVD
jgi:hypothetical protein